MKFRLILPMLAVMMISGCGVLNGTDQQTLATSLDEAKAQLHGIQDQLHEQQAASTQPNATQPAPPPAAVKAVDDLSKKIDQLSTAVNNLPQNPNPGQIIQAAAPLTGPYAPWVGLAGILVTAVWGLFQKKDATTSKAALTTATDGLKAAISTGAITVTPNAPAIVDAAVTDHPQTSALVDALSDGAKVARIN